MGDGDGGSPGSGAMVAGEGLGVSLGPSSVGSPGWLLRTDGLNLHRRDGGGGAWVFRSGPGVLRRRSDGHEWVVPAATMRLSFGHGQ